MTTTENTHIQNLTLVNAAPNVTNSGSLSESGGVCISVVWRGQEKVSFERVYKLYSISYNI